MRNGPDRRAFLAWAAYTAASRCVTAGPPPENCNLPTNLIQSLPEGKAFTPETTVLPRRTISSLTGSELGKLFDDLTRAYTVLKSRSDQRADDPTGLLYQGWLHDYYCGSGGHDVHRSWFFLPWHRAFVYFHELILRGILGDHFRLPVWDWENVDAVPYFYRNWAASHGCEQFSVGLNGKVVSCSLQAWLLSETPGQDFLGTDQQSGNAQAGPHTFVHSQIGGLLADPKTAAADPLFYAHHTNVDRFWCYWRRHYQFGDRPEWLQKSFCFFDGHGQPVKITVQDLVSEERLGYQYPQSPTVDLYPFQTVIGNLSGAARAVSFPTPDLNRFLNLP